jgi:hypothetical protein
MDSLALEALGGANAFPGARELDQDALAVDAELLVQLDQSVGLGDRPLGVEAERGIDLSRYAAGDDLEDLAAKSLSTDSYEIVTKTLGAA